ncbi:MAG: hypothetical protein U9Q04_02580 [Campylobacterota bacterium]|nr:hypothetical protein [Campylobacterota bacterium]
MRYIVYLFLTLTLLIASVYIVLFTPVGHGIIKDKITSNIKTHTALDAKVEKFSLSPSIIDISIVLPQNNTIIINGTYSIFSKGIDLNYRLNFNDISIFSNLSKQNLKGKLNTQGRVFGNIENINIKGQSDLAKSDTKYNFILSQNKKSYGKLEIKDALLSEILYMTGQNNYAKGDINIDIDLDDVKSGEILGKALLKIDNGIVNKKLVKKDFDIDLPETEFISVIDANIKKIVDFNMLLDSSIANINSKGTFDQGTQKLVSKYQVKIDDLLYLQPLTKHPLRGEISANGDIVKSEKLEASFNSKIFGGTIDTTLDDSLLIGKLSNIDTMKLMYMLHYPEIYKGKINGKVDTDIKSDKLDFYFDLKNGHFVSNQFTSLISQFLKIDITNEKFSYAVLEGIKTKENIDAKLEMRSLKMKILSKKFNMDTKNNLIDAVLFVELGKYKFDVNIKGDINSPKVTSDIAKKVIKDKAKSKIEERLGDKLDENTKSIINKIFKF